MQIVEHAESVSSHFGLSSVAPGKDGRDDCPTIIPATIPTDTATAMIVADVATINTAMVMIAAEVSTSSTDETTMSTGVTMMHADVTTSATDVSMMTTEVIMMHAEVIMMSADVSLMSSDGAASAADKASNAAEHAAITMFMDFLSVAHHQTQNQPPTLTLWRDKTRRTVWQLH